MPAKMTTAYREHASGSIIEGLQSRKNKQVHTRIQRERAKIDADFIEARKNWVFVPPSNMTLLMRFPEGELILSIPHSIGSMLLHKRRAHILESNVRPDAVIVAEDYEEAYEFFGLGADNRPKEPESILIALRESAYGIPADVPIQVPRTFGTLFVDAGLATVVEPGEPALVITERDLQA